MIIFNFISYFILVLRDFPRVQISQGFSLCYAIPASPTFSGLRSRMFSFDPPLCYMVEHACHPSDTEA
jgi:hypothetical protein